MKEVTLTVEGMTCMHCVKAVEGALVKAGAAGKVDLASKKAEVKFDENATNLEKIRAAIEEEGYSVG